MLNWNNPILDQVELGKRIRSARERVGMSQEALAEALGRDQKAMSEYETGKRKVPATDIPTFATILGVPFSYFFEGEFQMDELDQVLLQEFHTLPTTEDKHTALQAVRLISDTVRRHTPSRDE
ncbi:MAG: helix-turn-helix transcriptional regulator [Anaerolineae bacterium]|nr:helix-turn-helix transcriptional regulator [Anaerolineae bacterium]